jgi:starch synthase
MPQRIKILFVAAEASPLVKIGGLGDVAGSLPASLRALPEAPDVRAVLPYYPTLKKQKLKTNPVAAFTINTNSEELVADIHQIKVNNVPFYLIDGAPVAASPSVYSADNHLDGMKFCFFSLAALELARNMKWQPDILHAHDWHAAPAVYHLRLIRESEPFFEKTRSLLTVHNLPYLGHNTQSALREFALPKAHLSPLPEWAEHLPLPLGLLSADKINTVSPGYAEEMLTPEFGAGLDPFLATREKDLIGVLNGLDMELWDPSSDTSLVQNYTVNSLIERQENKVKLLEKLELSPKPDFPLMAMINRMDHQKGVDLLPDALRMLSDQNWQAVILGTGDYNLEEQAAQLDRDYPQIRSVLKFDGELARRIYAGSDLIIIPSRYEPCGLTQMIGMRYGCVPLARATGGLKDTIIDYNYGKKERSTGFLFNDADAESLAACLERALALYPDKRRWRGLQRRGMKIDFSWEKAARQYFRVYQSLVK